MDNVQGFEIMGYLVNFRIKPSDINTDDFNSEMENLKSKGYSCDDVDMMKMEKRRPIDAYKKALKAVYGLDDSKSRTRIYLRKADPSESKDKRIIVHEDFSKSKTGIRTPIGTIDFDAGTIVSTFYTSNNVVDNDYFESVINAISEDFNEQLMSFNSSSVRYRFSEIINDCLPFYYDAEHNFKFISREHKDRIDLMKDVVSCMNRMASVSTQTRDKQSEVCCMPIPDIEETREEIEGALSKSLLEEKAAVEKVINDASAHTDTRRVCEAIERSKNIISSLEKHRDKLRLDAATLENEMMNIKNNLAVILGNEEERSPKRNMTWESATKKMPEAQHMLGMYLKSIDGVETIVKPHMECIVFKKGDVRIIQTGLVGDMSDSMLRITVSGVQSLPEDLDTIGFIMSNGNAVIRANSEKFPYSDFSDWIESL